MSEPKSPPDEACTTNSAHAIIEHSAPVQHAWLQAQTRRHFLSTCTSGLGALFLSSLVARPSIAAIATGVAAGGVPRLDFTRDPTAPLSPLPPQFAARARRVIYLHMAGAPSQLELFEHKPELTRLNGQDCPASFLAGKRFAFISGVPKMMGSVYPFHRSGQTGTWISDRLPYLEKHLDELCFIHSMRTDQFNHAPAQMLVQTGNARLGHPSLGSWVTYGLGTENQNLPGFIVLLSGSNTPDGGKQLWGSAFLPSAYQGVECRSQGEPVLYLNNPTGVSRPLRRLELNAVDEINRKIYAEFGNPETMTRIAQYEMAFRMQVTASDAMDIHREPKSVLASYGAKPGQASFANNCLLARRLAERGVRFIQLYHYGWDNHGGGKGAALTDGFADRCRETDQPVAALLADLKSRGLLDDTLVVWGGEFGRTPMLQNTGDSHTYPGRDHHPGAFTIWMTGGGVKSGLSYGETDDMGYEIVKNPVEIRDLHATMMYLLGFDHHKLNFSFQGLDQKLTGVLPARVVAEVLA